MTCTAACAAGMLNSTPVMSCTPSLSGSITIIDTPSPRGTTPNVHGRAVHTMSCRYSTVAYYTAWHATQRDMRHSVACDTRVACDIAWHATQHGHVHKCLLLQAPLQTHCLHRMLLLSTAMVMTCCDLSREFTQHKRILARSTGMPHHTCHHNVMSILDMITAD